MGEMGLDEAVGNLFEGMNYRQIRMARIDRYYSDLCSADITMLDGPMRYYKVLVRHPYISTPDKGNYAGFMIGPRVSDIVLVGFKFKRYPEIIGYVPSDITRVSRKPKEGEIILVSPFGSSMFFSASGDVWILSSAGYQRFKADESKWLANFGSWDINIGGLKIKTDSISKDVPALNIKPQTTVEVYGDMANLEKLIEMKLGNVYNGVVPETMNGSPLMVKMVIKGTVVGTGTEILINKNGEVKLKATKVVVESAEIKLGSDVASLSFLNDLWAKKIEGHVHLQADGEVTLGPSSIDGEAYLDANAEARFDANASGKGSEFEDIPAGAFLTPLAFNPLTDAMLKVKGE